jgi:hypothetical protein
VTYNQKSTIKLVFIDPYLWAYVPRPLLMPETMDSTEPNIKKKNEAS